MANTACIMVMAAERMAAMAAPMMHPVVCSTQKQQCFMFTNEDMVIKVEELNQSNRSSRQVYHLGGGERGNNGQTADNTEIIRIIDTQFLPFIYHPSKLCIWLISEL